MNIHEIGRTDACRNKSREAGQRKLTLGKADKDRHDTLVALVEERLALKAREAAEVLPQARTVVQRQAAALDRRIDSAVYALYGLTTEKISATELPAVVEGAAGAEARSGSGGRGEGEQSGKEDTHERI